MELLEKSNWKMEILLITVKTNFCNAVFEMLTYIGPKGRRDFWDMFTLQITRRLILLNSFFKDASLIKVSL